MPAWGSPSVWVTVLLLVAATPAAWLGVVAWQHRRVPGATPLAFAALLVAFGLALAALEISSANLAVKQLIANLETISQAFLPVVWLLVVLEFTGHEPRLRRAVPWLFIVPVVTLALVFTNRWTGLLPPSGPDSAAAVLGSWHWAQTFYSAGLLTASLVLLVQAWLAVPSQRDRLTALLACMLAPLAWLVLAGWQPASPATAAVPAALVLATLFIVWGLFSFHLFDVMPQAQTAVIAGLSEAVVVLDVDQRLAHFNPAAAALFGWTRPGGPAALALADWPELTAALNGEPAPAEIVKGLGAERRVYELALARLADPHGRPLGQVLTLRDATERRRIEDELARLTTTDDVTGLADRKRLYQAVRDEVRRARRYDAPLALLLLDLDHFKALNETKGRQAGDEALRAVARALGRLARQSDLPARVGDDKFALVLPHTNLLGAETVAGRLVAAVSQMKIADGQALSLSVGAAELVADDDDEGEALLARAEAARRAAKQAGGGRVMVEETAKA